MRQFFFFFFKQKTAYEILSGLVGSEMCIRDRVWCGVVWCGVVWCGVVWCGVVWRGVVWCGVVLWGMVWRYPELLPTEFFSAKIAEKLSGK